MTGPVTLADLVREDKLLWVYCRDCCPRRKPRYRAATTRNTRARSGEAHEVLQVRIEGGGNETGALPRWYPGHARTAELVALRASRLLRRLQT